jgi:hypothetical protein
MQQATAPIVPPEDANAPVVLSPQEREKLRISFARDGYVVVPNVVPNSKLAAFQSHLAETYENALRSGALDAVGGRGAGHLNFFAGEAARFAYDALQESAVLDLIKAIYPRPLSGPLVPNVGGNLNLPDSIVQHYHADSQFTEEFIIANVSVVDTDASNGATCVVPGTHTAFQKYWRFVVEGGIRAGTQVSTKRGDVLIRSSNLWHRGMPNRTASPRPMLAFNFGQKGVVERDGDPFRAHEGKIFFYDNWYRPTWRGRLRERAYIAAPFTYEAYRFVTSLVRTRGSGSGI